MLLLLAPFALAACGGNDDEPIYQLIYPGGFVRAVDDVEGMAERLGVPIVEPPHEAMPLAFLRAQGHVNTQSVVFYYGPDPERPQVSLSQFAVPAHVDANMTIGDTSVARRANPFGGAAFEWLGCDRRFSLSVAEAGEALAHAFIEAIVERCPDESPAGVPQQLAILARDAELAIEADGVRRPAESLSHLVELAPFEIIAPSLPPESPAGALDLAELVVVLPDGADPEAPPHPGTEVRMHFADRAAGLTVALAQGTGVADGYEGGHPIGVQGHPTLGTRAAVSHWHLAPGCPDAPPRCSTAIEVFEACDRGFVIEGRYEDGAENVLPLLSAMSSAIYLERCAPAS